MSRLIDGDALYEQLKQDEEMAINRVLDTESSLPYPNNLNPLYTRYVAQMNERTRLKHMIADAPTIEERKTQWISCDDKVPIVSGEFLVTLTDADGEWVSTAEWNTTFGGRWQDIFPDDGYRDISNVIAWMPLPEPYEGGNDA